MKEHGTDNGDVLLATLPAVTRRSATLVVDAVAGDNRCDEQSIAWM